MMNMFLKPFQKRSAALHASVGFVAFLFVERRAMLRAISTSSPMSNRGTTALPSGKATWKTGPGASAGRAGKSLRYCSPGNALCSALAFASKLLAWIFTFTKHERRKVGSSVGRPLLFIRIEASIACVGSDGALKPMRMRCPVIASTRDISCSSQSTIRSQRASGRYPASARQSCIARRFRASAIASKACPL